eukprot:3778506-Prymnesium_polylepis.1
MEPQPGLSDCPSLTPARAVQSSRAASPPGVLGEGRARARCRGLGGGPLGAWSRGTHSASLAARRRVRRPRRMQQRRSSRHDVHLLQRTQQRHRVLVAVAALASLLSFKRVARRPPHGAPRSGATCDCLGLLLLCHCLLFASQVSCEKKSAIFPWPPPHLRKVGASGAPAGWSGGGRSARDGPGAEGERREGGAR